MEPANRPPPLKQEDYQLFIPDSHVFVETRQGQLFSRLLTDFFVA
jgi:hypothetical protein